MSSDGAKHATFVLAFLTAVSIFGLVLSTLLVFHPFSTEANLAYLRPAVGTAFGLVCVFGMFAALFPSSCSSTFKFRNKGTERRSTGTIHETTFQAHHPSCDNYVNHILNVGKMKFCATCSGLLVGATLVLLGTALYFFGGCRLGNPVLLYSLGAVGVTLGLIQSALPKVSVGLTRFFFSIFFVVGTFLMLTGADDAVKNISIDFFLIALSVVWILTKISLSQRDHQRTCLNCSAESCRWNKKRVG